MRILDECRIDEVNTGALGKFLVGTVKEKLCLTDDLIDEFCGKAFADYLITKNIVAENEKERLKKSLSITLKLFMHSNVDQLKP